MVNIVSNIRIKSTRYSSNISSARIHTCIMLKYIAHICRSENNDITKRLFFATAMKKYYWDLWLNIPDMSSVSIEQAKKGTQNKHNFAKLVQERTSSPL